MSDRIRALLTHSEATAELCRVALGELPIDVLPPAIQRAHEERPEWAMRLLWDVLLEQEEALGED